MSTVVYLPDMQKTKYIPTWDGSYKRTTDKSPVNQFLQRILFWLLDKLGCRYQRKEIHFNFRTEKVEFTEVIDAILSQRNAVLDVLHKDCQVVVLGADKMRELRLSADRYYALQLPDSVADLWQYDGKTFAGLTVVFCPWFEGVLTLPSVELLV